jgi:hypothetical protein
VDLPALRAVSAFDGLALGAQQVGVVKGGAALKAEPQVLGRGGQILRREDGEDVGRRAQAELLRQVARAAWSRKK